MRWIVTMLLLCLFAQARAGEDGLRVLVAYVEGGGLVGRRERDSKIPDRSNFG